MAVKKATVDATMAKVEAAKAAAPAKEEAKKAGQYRNDFSGPDDILKSDIESRNTD